jgi:hypothetical protein
VCSLQSNLYALKAERKQARRIWSQGGGPSVKEDAINDIIQTIASRFLYLMSEGRFLMTSICSYFFTVLLSICSYFGPVCSLFVLFFFTVLWSICSHFPTVYDLFVLIYRTFYDLFVLIFGPFYDLFVLISDQFIIHLLLFLDQFIIHLF